MTTNYMFLRDMKMMMKRDTNGTRSLRAILTKAMLLALLFLVGGTRPCGTLCLQRMVSEAWAVIS